MSSNLERRRLGNRFLRKSLTGTIFDTRDAKFGNLSTSLTTEVTIYDIGNGNFYVYTPGFDDSDELRAMMILRATTSFKKEARFIESLARDYDGNVWDNTIIITK
ncbi:20133_t:CDS:2 [Gigaspora rosea]|nr:20133_t:CDS:2 [Gigaspora rosea]